MVESIKRFVADAGYRVFWTAVQAAAGVVGALALPADLPSWVYPISVIAFASLATFLKERARKRLDAQETWVS